MRVLWIKMGGLWPINTGGRRRSFEILSALSRAHQVALVTTHGPGDDPAGLAANLPHCERVASVPFEAAKHGSARFAAAYVASSCTPYPVDLWKWRCREVRRAAARLLDEAPVDVVIADFLFAVPNLPRRRRVPAIYFSHNVEHLIWKRLARVDRRWWRRRIFDIEWRKCRRIEQQTCRALGLTITVSDEDRGVLAASGPDADVVAVPTGVDAGYFRPPGESPVPGRLVFSGSMDWYPNEDAMVHFVEDVLPRVRRAVPGATLSIIGRAPSPRVRALADHPGVEVTGTVADVRPHVGAGEVYVVPLRVGGGTRLKIFEALAMERPVVSTTLGAEGLGLEPGRHALFADGSDAFAAAIVDLLADPDRRLALGREGRRLVEDRYSWAVVARAFEDACRRVLLRRDHVRNTAERRAHLSRA